MIAARLHNADGVIALLLVLEPGNLEKLKEGKPIVKFLNEFFPELPNQIQLLLAYTPDAAWVAENAKASKSNLLQLLEESLSREPVLVRGKSAEEMEKFE